MTPSKAVTGASSSRSFDPTEVLQTIRPHLPSGSFMVEGPTGFRRYTEGMTDWELVNAEQVPFEELLQHPATRVVVVSPEHDTEEFLSIVERMGLQRVSYSIGWTAWLDISPDGVSKATAMERVRHALDIPRSRVVAVGDGRNDIELLQLGGSTGSQRRDGPGAGRGEGRRDAAPPGPSSKTASHRCSTPSDPALLEHAADRDFCRHCPLPCQAWSPVCALLNAATARRACPTERK